MAGVAEIVDHTGVGTTEEGEASCAAKMLAVVYAFEQEGYTRMTHAPDL